MVICFESVIARASDSALVDSVDVDAVSVVIVPGASRTAIDSVARVLDPARRDSTVVIVALGVTVQKGLLFCSEPTIDLHLPSEKSIPAEVVKHKPDGERETQLHRFRYDPTGTEGRAGIPYWIFRVMPKLFARDLDNKGYKIRHSPPPRGKSRNVAFVHFRWALGR